MWSLSFLGPGEVVTMKFHTKKERRITFVFCVNAVKLHILIIMIMMQKELMQCVRLFVIAISMALLPVRSIIHSIVSIVL